MRLEQLLTEGLSQVLFHRTGIMNAVEILEDDEMRASGVVKDVEVTFKTSANQLYYVSFARNKNSAYMTDSDGKPDIGDAIFTFNGRGLANNYSGNSVDYWQSNVFGHEMEDRLYSTDPYIEGISRYIEKIDLYFPDPRDDSLHKMYEERKERFFRHIRMLITRAKQRNIEVVVHSTPRSLLSPHGRDIVPLKTFFETRPEPDTRKHMGTLRSDGDMLDAVKQLLFEPDIDELGKRARSYAFDMRRGRLSDDFIRQLKAALHNEMKNVDNINPILQFMRRNNLRTVEDLAEVIFDRWDES